MNRYSLALCLLFALASNVPHASAQVILSDDFGEPGLNPRWIPLGTGCAAPRVEAGEVVLSGLDGCSQNSTDIFLDPYRYRIGGDFDVSFDLRLVTFSPTTAVAALVAGIELQRVDGGSYAVVERYYNSSIFCTPSHSNYKGWFQISDNCSGSVNWAVASNPSGSFRITRVGTTVTEYYSEGSGWSVLNVGTRPADSLEIALYAGATGGSGVPYDVRIDNFQISADIITAVPTVAFEPRPGLWLAPPVPNPSTAASEIAYSISERTLVHTEILDPAGRIVRVIEDGVLQTPGAHRVFWDGRDKSMQAVKAGVYFARVVSGSRVATRALIRLK